MKTTPQDLKLATPRKYMIRKHLDEIGETYGPDLRQQVMTMFVGTAGCSRRKVENYIRARVGDDTAASTCPQAYLMVFQAIINRIRLASDLMPLELDDLYHPDARHEMVETDFPMPEIQLS